MRSKPRQSIFFTSRAGVCLMMSAVFLLGIFLANSGHAVTLSVVDSHLVAASQMASV